MLVALAVLAVAYVMYRYHGSIDMPDISFKGLRKIGTVVPYLAATLFSVVFQMWNRRRQRAARERMERQLMQEGPVRRSDGLAVRQGRGRLQSYEADLHLSRAALYVFDRANKRDPQRIETQSASTGAFIEDAMLEAGASGGPPTVRIAIGGAKRQVLEFTSPDAAGWWVDVRRSIGRSADVEEELAEQEAEEAEYIQEAE